MDKTRLLRGFGWGVMATIAMSVVMIVGTMTGMSPARRCRHVLSVPLH